MKINKSLETNENQRKPSKQLRTSMRANAQPMQINEEYTKEHEELSAKLYAVCDPACSAIGVELWQVRAGTLFDDIILTDSVSYAKGLAERAREKLLVERESWYMPYRDGAELEEEEYLGEEEVLPEEDVKATTSTSRPSMSGGASE